MILRIRLAVRLMLLVPLVWGCSSGDAPPVAAELPAHVEAPRPEGELTTVRLSAEAARRLGIQTVIVSTGAASTTRSLGGEVRVPDGRLATITAPIAGTLSAVSALPGSRVARGTRLMTLTPLAAPEREQGIEARRAVDAAQADVEVMRLRVQRLEQLLKDGAASQRSVEEARGLLQVSTAALQAAQSRLAAIEQGPVGATGQVAITAPLEGIIQSIAATNGQTVAPAAPLLEIAQVSTLWVRVPAFAGDVEQMDLTQPVAVSRLGGHSAPLTARRIPAPLRADPMAASVDLFYELPGAAAGLRPGERVMVAIPLKDMARGLVVPDAAVLYDIHGDAWVYEDLGNHAYVRRRIEVARHVGDRVVIARGVRDGVKVITAGAAELFGTEFGAGH